MAADRLPGLSYAPVPEVALEIAEDRADADAAITLVTLLYREAHRARWGWLRHTTRDLARARGVHRSVVDALLNALADRGLLDLEDVTVGGRKEGIRVRLFDPTTITLTPEGRAVPRPPKAPPQQGQTPPAKPPPPPATERPRTRTREQRQDAAPRDDADHGSDDRTATYDRSTDRPSLIPTPPPPPPAGAGESSAEARVGWVERKALEQLDRNDDDALARRYARGEGEVVDAWRSAVRPERAKVTTLDGPRTVTRRGFPDAPDGLRKHEIRRGLQRAGARWLAANDRGPPLGVRDDDLHHHPGAPP